MQKRYIPNLLSVVRLCLVPLFAYIFFLDYPQHVAAAILIFFLAGATDVLDGWIARRNGWVSNLGKVLDPLADKLMQCTVLICFYIKEIIPIWLMLLYVGKELLVLAGSLFVFRRQKVVVKSNFFGKMAVCVFYASIGVLPPRRRSSASSCCALRCWRWYSISACISGQKVTNPSPKVR